MTLEKLGSRMDISLRIAICIDVMSAEPMTWTYPGYPGSVQLNYVQVQWYANKKTGLKVHRDHRRDWFVMLDRIASGIVGENWEKITEDVINDEPPLRAHSRRDSRTIGGH